MTAAAGKLFLTQPAVSQQIHSLEEELGCELLVRGVRQVKPTSQGLFLYEYSRKILNLVEQTKIGIQTMGAEVAGPLRVATVNSIGLHVIGPVFSLFLKSNNKVSIKLRYLNGPEIISLLESGEADIAVLPDSLKEYGKDPEDCKKQLLFEDEMWLMCSGQDDSTPKSTTLKDLGKKPFVLLHEEYPGFENTFAKELKKTNSSLNVAFECSNTGTLKRMIETGMGWGFLPAHSVRKQIQTGRLKRVDVSDFQYKMDVYCYRPSSREIQVSDLFIKALRQLNFSPKTQE